MGAFRAGGLEAAAVAFRAGGFAGAFAAGFTVLFTVGLAKAFAGAFAGLAAGFCVRTAADFVAFSGLTFATGCSFPAPQAHDHP